MYILSISSCCYAFRTVFFPSLMVKDLAFVGAASLTCRKSAVAVELYCVLSCFVVNYAFVVFSVLCLLASDL